MVEPTDTISRCKDLVLEIGRIQAAKRAEYGPSWWVFRFESLVEKVFIKANRLRTIGEAELSLVEDSVDEDLKGIFSYAVMAIAKLRSDADSIEIPPEWSSDESAAASYMQISEEILDLLARKNHDYGEAWRSISTTMMIDEIIARTVRLRTMQANAAPQARMEDQLFDVANYALLLLVREHEERERSA